MTFLTRRDFLYLTAASAILPAGAAAQAQGQETMYDAIIVGAGLSGLCAAQRLSERGISNLLVLEARARLGGRIVNHQVAGLDLEAGAQWVGPEQSRMHALADQFGIERYPTYLSGNAKVRWMRQNHTVSQKELFAQSEKMRTSIDMLDRTAASVPLKAPWEHPEAARLDALSVSDWAQKFGLTDETIQELLSETVDALGGSSSMSALDYLWSVHSCGGHEQINRFEGGAQDSRMVGGPSAIIEALGNQLYDQIRVGAPVSSIEYERDRATINVGRLTLRARKCILALSPWDMQRIQFSPELPDIRRDLNKNWHMEPGLKAHIVYKTPFWRERGLSGLAVGQRLIEASMDNTPLNGEFGYGALLLFLSKQAASLTSQERYNGLINELKGFFGRRATSPIGYAEMNWADDDWSGGCTSPLPPGVLTKYGASLFENIASLHFAGTETATEWRGYMEGAVQAGERSADEVFGAL